MIWLIVAGLSVLVVLWAIGKTVQEAAKKLGKRRPTVVGAGKVREWAKAGWANRAGLLGAACAASIVVACGLLALEFVRHEEQRQGVALTFVLVVGGGLVLWDNVRHPDGEPYRQSIADTRRRRGVARAVTAAHPGVKPGHVEFSPGGARVHVEHLDNLDVDRLSRAAHAGHVTVREGAQRGWSEINLAVEPPVPEWAALSVDRPWPGPSSTYADAPIPVAVDAQGRTVSIPVPGDGGRHLLVGGSTGSGKSVLLSAIIAELAYRDIDIRLADPKLIEFAPWSPRAPIARGAPETGQMLDDVYDEMMARYQSLEGTGRRQYNGRRIVLVIDELAAVTTGPSKETAPRIQKLGLILGMGRAAQVGLVICSLRPSRDVIPLDLRDNCRVRIGLGCESPYQTEMIMGDQTRWACHELPESMPGVCYVRIDRSATLCRSFLLADEDIDRVAAHTAHLARRPS